MLINDIKSALLINFNRTNRLKPYLALKDTTWLNIEVWIQGECNSRATVVANDTGNDFTGRKTIYFNRRSIAVDLEGLKIPGKRSDYNGFRSVITALRDKCGVPLNPLDFLEVALPATGPITIQPTIVCMAYLPSTNIQMDFAET